MTTTTPIQSGPQRAKTIACSPFSPDRLKLMSERVMREKWRERERETESLDFSSCTVCMYLYPIYNFILACKWERWDYYPRLFKKFGCNFNLLEDILVDFYILGFIS